MHESRPLSKNHNMNISYCHYQIAYAAKIRCVVTIYKQLRRVGWRTYQTYVPWMRWASPVCGPICALETLLPHVNLEFMLAFQNHYLLLQHWWAVSLWTYNAQKPYWGVCLVRHLGCSRRPRVDPCACTNNCTFVNDAVIRTYMHTETWRIAASPQSSQIGPVAHHTTTYIQTKESTKHLPKAKPLRTSFSTRHVLAPPT